MKHDPIHLLMEEHERIKTAVAVLQELRQAPLLPELKAKSLKSLIGFFRQFADEYHHRKEEELLFPAMRDQVPLLGEGILKEMLEQHDTMRAMIQEAIRCLSDNNVERALECMGVFADALLDHIAVEDDEVFQIAQSHLSAETLDIMYFRFIDKDRELGNETKAELERSLKDLVDGISR